MSNNSSWLRLQDYECGQQSCSNKTPKSMGCLEPSQESLPNLMSLLPTPTFGLFLVPLINNNNMHGLKLPPNESPKTFPRHYLQQTIDNRP